MKSSATRRGLLLSRISSIDAALATLVKSPLLAGGPADVGHRQKDSSSADTTSMHEAPRRPGSWVFVGVN